LDGPPGSGKTNLLLLRAQYIAGSGDKNVLIVTFTKVLADFIKTGIAAKGLIQTQQIRTFHSWAVGHVRENLGRSPLEQDADFDDKVRSQMVEAILEANSKAATKSLYSAIFVDEAQDFSVQELEGLLSLSENICVCGDVKQGIYKKDGLDIASRLSLARHTLKTHYRIGHRIAHVADRLIPPTAGGEKLEATCNYNPKIQGKSTAEMHFCVSRDDQFSQMMNLLRIQLDAFRGENIGILCGKKDTLRELREKFDSTDSADLVSVYTVDQDFSFGGDRPIKVLTIHSAKGTEFRAVHVYGAEELETFPLNRRPVAFTAITRARTALNVYVTGQTNAPFENAFAKPQHMTLEQLFEGDHET
jgi:superfamily I DNA/RNA helicase